MRRGERDALKPTPIRIPRRSILVDEPGSVSVAINRRLPAFVEDAWVAIATARGWPLWEMAGIGLGELLAFEERAVAELKAGAGR